MPRRWIAGSAVCLLAWWAGPLSGAPVVTTEPAESDAGTQMQASVRPIAAPTASQKIQLFAGHGILIDTNKPVRRAVIGGQGIAEVSIISPRQVMVSGKALGTTNLILWDGDDNQVIYTIVVTPDLAPLRDAIAAAAPGAKVEVVSLGGKIVLRGVVPDVDTCESILNLAHAFTGTVAEAAAPTEGRQGGSAGKAESGAGSASTSSGSGQQAAGDPLIINQLVIAGEHQVVLRCTVAEVTKTAMRQLGINGWMGGNNFHDFFAVNQIAGINPVSIGAANFIPVGGAHAPAIPFALTDGALRAASDLTLGFPRVQLQLFFQAMRDNRLLRVLAEPNLVALSGQEASFLAGGEFPFEVPQSLGTVTIEWKNFGIQLHFTPTVIGRQMVRLRVRPEVSDLDFSNAISLNGVLVPSIISRRTETTIELASGSTIAIAGLLSQRVRGQAQKIPALGDVPVLGALFSSVQYQKDETELVVLVTPELVSALHPDQVDPVPGQFMRDPNDWELFGLGQLEGEPICEAEGPEGALETRVPPRYPKLASPPDQMTLHGPWGPADGTEGNQ